MTPIKPRENDDGHISRFAKGIDHMFDYFGLELVPNWIRYIIMTLLITLPMWLLAILFYLGDLDDKNISSHRKSKEERHREKMARKAVREVENEMRAKAKEARGRRFEKNEKFD